MVVLLLILGVPLGVLGWIICALCVGLTLLILISVWDVWDYVSWD